MNVCLLPLISLLPAVNKTKRQSVDRSETFEKLEKKEEKVTLKEEEKKQISKEAIIKFKKNKLK